MRKFKFNTQLIILFFGLLCLSSALFGMIVIGRVRNISETQTYDRLESYIEVTKSSWHNCELAPETSKSINLCTIQGRIRVYPHNLEELKCSKNFKDVIGFEQIDILLNAIEFRSDASGHATINLENSTKIYYAYQTTAVENDSYTFIVAVANTKYAREFSNNISSQIILIFSIVFIFAFFILGLWSSAYVARINRLKKHIANLPASNYKEEYVDDGKDELADLSKSIEQMRNEILHNESTKQEMLQNISHDFKTPIAVIKSYAEAIEDGMVDKSDAKIIQNQCTNLQHKVTTLLQYNRLEYLEKKEEFQNCNMKEIIESVVNTYIYQKTKLKFTLDLDECYYKGYQENYYTVIDNIIDNAKRYAKSEIKISLHDGVIQIYNDGEHIDEQFLNGFFKPYEKGSKGQFGLGMSIVKKTLDFFGYYLSVRNEEVGVTFEIKKRVNCNIYTQ